MFTLQADQAFGRCVLAGRQRVHPLELSLLLFGCGRRQATRYCVIQRREGIGHTRTLLTQVPINAADHGRHFIVGRHTDRDLGESAHDLRLDLGGPTSLRLCC